MSLSFLSTLHSIFISPPAKSPSTCKEEEADDHDAGVSEVEEGGSRPLDVQLGDKVVNAVDRQVKRRES